MTGATPVPEGGWVLESLYDFSDDASGRGYAGDGAHSQRVSQTSVPVAWVNPGSGVGANSPLPNLADARLFGSFTGPNPPGSGGAPFGGAISLCVSPDGRYLYSPRFDVLFNGVNEPWGIGKIDLKTGNTVAVYNAGTLPNDLCSDAVGNVYWTGTVGFFIGRVSVDGTVNPTWTSVMPGNAGGWLTKVGNGKDGFLYATQGSSVWRVALDGTVTELIAAEIGTWESTTTYGHMVADASGDLYIQISSLDDRDGSPTDSLTGSVFDWSAALRVDASAPNGQTDRPYQGWSVLRRYRPAPDSVGFTPDDGQFINGTGNWQVFSGDPRYVLSKTTAVRPAVSGGVMRVYQRSNASAETATEPYLDGRFTPYIFRPGMTVTFSCYLMADVNNDYSWWNGINANNFGGPFAAPPCGVIGMQPDDVFGDSVSGVNQYSNGGWYAPISQGVWTYFESSTYINSVGNQWSGWDNPSFNLDFFDYGSGNSYYVSNCQTTAIRPGGALKDFAIQRTLNPTNPPFLTEDTNIVSVGIDASGRPVMPMAWTPYNGQAYPAPSGGDYNPTGWFTRLHADGTVGLVAGNDEVWGKVDGPLGTGLVRSPRATGMDQSGNNFYFMDDAADNFVDGSFNFFVNGCTQLRRLTPASITKGGDHANRVHRR